MLMMRWEEYFLKKNPNMSNWHIAFTDQIMYNKHVLRKKTLLFFLFRKPGAINLRAFGIFCPLQKNICSYIMLS